MGLPADAPATTALLSCYAQSFDNGIWHVTWGGEPEFSYRPGWLDLIGQADASGLQAWHRKRRMTHELDRLEGAHVGESPLWIRWSHPSDNVESMLQSWNRYATWNRRAGTGLDLVAVVDRGTQGEHVWHIHGYGFGPDLDLTQHASRWGRAGGYPFVRARRLRTSGAEGEGPPAPAANARAYMLRRLRGYISAKQGARRLRLRS